jgi:hypothetical protein
VPSRIHCPECETPFAYSPALLGRTVRCRQCHHTFAVATPPADGPLAALPSAESSTGGPPPLPKPAVPPPLPPRVVADNPRSSRSSSRPVESRERERRRAWDDDDDPRRRPAAAVEPKSGAGTLIALVLLFGFGFLAIAGGVGYLLWPTSSNTAPVVQGPAAPTDPPAAMDNVRDLDQIMKDRPDRGDAANRPGVPEPQRPPGPPGPDPGMFPPGIEPPPKFPGLPPPIGVEPPPGPPPIRPRPGRRGPIVPKLPAVAAPKFLPVTPLAIQPTPLSTDRDLRNLAGTIETAVAAGGGRLLLLHMPQRKQVAVFDVNTAKVVKHIAATDDRVFVAGGMNVFVIYLAGKDILERWNCTTLEREAELKSPFGAEVLDLAMGSASNGPLAAALGGARIAPLRGATICYFDPMTGKEVQYEVNLAQNQPHNPFGISNQDLRQSEVRVSADGSVVTGWGEGAVGQSDVMDGGRLNHHWKLGVLDPILPMPDGQSLLDRQRRVNTDLGDADRMQFQRDPQWLIPAVQGDFHVVLRGNAARARPLEPLSAFAEVRFGTEFNSLLRIGELRDFALPNGFDSRGKTFDRNVFLIPDAKLLAVVPTQKREQLVLYRADLDKTLANAGLDYLYVASRPPTAAVKGETYRYATVVKSKRGGVKVTLDAGPKGMAVTPAGAVTWDVPKDFAESETNVQLKVADATSREVLHTFRLTPIEKPKETGEPKKK